MAITFFLGLLPHVSLLCHHFHIPATAEHFTKEYPRFIYFFIVNMINASNLDQSSEVQRGDGAWDVSMVKIASKDNF